VTSQKFVIVSVFYECEKKGLRHWLLLVIKEGEACLLLFGGRLEFDFGELYHISESKLGIGF
jgi:hypothetical protein